MNIRNFPYFFLLIVPAIQITIMNGILHPGYFFSLSNILSILVCYVIIFGFGIEVGYHRYFSHRSFKLKAEKFLEPLISIVGMFALTHSPISWIFNHRQHHKFTDTPLDLTSPTNGGILYSFLLWNITSDPTKVKIRKNELLKSDFQRFIHDHYVLIVLGSVLILCWLFPLFTVFTLIPAMTLSFLAAGSANCISHLKGVGYRNFETPDHSNNLKLLGVLTFGLGYQNNHHFKQSANCMTMKPGEIDPGYWIVKVVGDV